MRLALVHAGDDLPILPQLMSRASPSIPWPDRKLPWTIEARHNGSASRRSGTGSHFVGHAIASASIL